MKTTLWSVDPNHSEIGFKVKHMMITNVSGQFKEFNGIMEVHDDNFENASLSFTGLVASLSTHNEARDNHLVSADFFNAAKFPAIAFKSTGLVRKNADEFELTGDLEMHGVTKVVQLKAEFGGIATDPWGVTKSAFVISGKINRKDWELNYNAALETGGVLISEQVQLNIELQFIKQE
jgi:polyisoprenoid-binding protein YceI